MTTKRSYYCNICRQPIIQETGVGLYWKTDEIILSRPIDGAESHVCWACAEQVADIVKNRGIE